MSVDPDTHRFPHSFNAPQASVEQIVLERIEDFRRSFFTLPTSRPTFHIFMRSGGYGWRFQFSAWLKTTVPFSLRTSTLTIPSSPLRVWNMDVA